MTTIALKWARYNLFGSAFDTLLSLVMIPATIWSIYEVLVWALSAAQWNIIPESLRVLMIGIFPANQIWRAWSAVMIIAAMLGGGLGCVFAFKPCHAAYLATLCVAGALLIGIHNPTNLAYLTGSIAAFAVVWATASCLPNTRRSLPVVSFIGLVLALAILAPPGAGLWGGLLLSVLLTLITSVVTLPIGILLAFGRRSRYSSARWICTAYIEIMRSVPLILVVYWIWILTPVLAPQLNMPDVVRGMIGFTIFYSAYVAEYVRSGLQAVPPSQTEAARSLGMGEFDIGRFIILPQALRVVVPSLVGNVLDIFNAAPLVFIIGLTDFLRAGQMMLANPQYSDRTYEVYSFLFVTYFLVGSVITFVARKLEIHLAKGSR